MNQRIAIVTGAGKRVGKVIAEALLADGWTVVAHVRSDGDAVPQGAIKAVADLAEPDCAARIFASVRGRPSMLVNCAARFAPDSLDAFDGGEFEAHMAVNVAAPVRLTHEFAERAGEGALVVNLLDAKLSAPNPDFLSYTLSKQALAGFTQIAARALGDKRIRVNAIAPALMLQSAGQSDENFALMHRHNPLAVGVEPDHVVAALRFLIDASATTGQVLTIDGGQHFWALERDVQFLQEDTE